MKQNIHDLSASFLFHSVSLTYEGCLQFPQLHRLCKFCLSEATGQYCSENSSVFYCRFNKLLIFFSDCASIHIFGDCGNCKICFPRYIFNGCSTSVLLFHILSPCMITTQFSPLKIHRTVSFSISVSFALRNEGSLVSGFISASFSVFPS